MKGGRNLAADYAAELGNHLAEPNEALLLHAYELGRRAVSDDVGVLDFAKLHHDALRQTMAAEWSESSRLQIDQAAAFFAESLSLFEMQLRGYRETIVRLEEANRELKNAQVIMVQNAKMASLGELVAGIAHEVNNPIAFSIAHAATVAQALADIAEHASKKLDQRSAARLARARTRIGDLRDGLTRVSELVTKLRTFSRLDEGEFKRVDMREGIESTLSLLAHRMRQGVRVSKRYCADNTLYCAAGPLNQVVMNLLANAIDAIGSEGEIFVSTERDQRAYCITIADDGPGVPPKLRERIFEPFFTTKSVGAGTGLGLALAYRIVERQKGSIEVGERPGGGAQFTVTIPTDLEEARHVT